MSGHYYAATRGDEECPTCELVNDKRRMDWLEQNRLIASIVWRYVDGQFTLRMAVDFAMKQAWHNLSGSMMRDEWMRVVKP